VERQELGRQDGVETVKIKFNRAGAGVASFYVDGVLIWVELDPRRRDDKAINAFEQMLQKLQR